MTQPADNTRPPIDVTDTTTVKHTTKANGARTSTHAEKKKRIDQLWRKLLLFVAGIIIITILVVLLYKLLTMPISSGGTSKSDFTQAMKEGTKDLKDLPSKIGDAVGAAMSTQFESHGFCKKDPATMPAPSEAVTSSPNSATAPVTIVPGPTTMSATEPLPTQVVNAPADTVVVESKPVAASSPAPDTTVYHTLCILTPSGSLFRSYHDVVIVKHTPKSTTFWDNAGHYIRTTSKVIYGKEYHHGEALPSQAVICTYQIDGMVHTESVNVPDCDICEDDDGGIYYLFTARNKKPELMKVPDNRLITPETINLPVQEH